MNCLEFRRAVGAEPNLQSPELEAHAQECAECARYREEMRRMDRLILRALTVEVDADASTRPAGLPQPRQWRPRWAIAASFIAAFALGALLWFAVPRESLAAQLVEHIQGEPKSLLAASAAVDTQTLADILTRSGVRLKPGTQTVTYAMSCWFRNHFVPHLVVRTEYGPITVLLLTQESPAAQREVFDEDGFHGVILPAPRGAIAVVGRDRQAERVADRMLQSVEYLP